MTRPILGVGWDVGGWVGKKQGVAVASFEDGRLQWRGTPRAFRLADLGRVDWSLVDLARQAWADAHDDTLDRYRVILAVDAPFGFPGAFVELLRTRQAPTFRPHDPEIQNPLAYRKTDRHVHEVFGKKPLSASFDKLGNNATVAIHHVERLAVLHGARVLPFQEPVEDGHVIIEVYPALAKSREGFNKLLPPGLPAGTDEHDACLCALMALAFTGEHQDLPALAGPPADDLEVKQEGWIYYPA